MTLVGRIVDLLRERGAAYAEFDDSGTDGQCWIVETKDAWFVGLAEEMIDLVVAEVKASPASVDILAVAFRTYARQARTEPAATAAYEHAARCVDKLRDS